MAHEISPVECHDSFTTRFDVFAGVMETQATGTAVAMVLTKFARYILASGADVLVFINMVQL